MTGRALILALAVGLVAGRGHAQPDGAPYAEATRVDYLARALAAVHGLGDAGRRDLEQALYQGARARCRAALAPPSIACTIELAQSICGPRPDAAACALAADVILTNQRAETEWVDEPTRMRLVAASADYHVALLAELDARHGALAADLVLAERGALTVAVLPARIDRLCARRDRDGPDWQRCAAALVWYAGARMEAP